MKLRASAAALVLSFSGFLVLAPCGASSGSDENVAVTHNKQGQVEFVVGRIHIKHPVEMVWPVLANPFEFERGISPRFHTTAVLVDRPERSLMECSVDTGFLLPHLKYTVESNYLQDKKISFKSVAGDFKDFEGSWGLEPAENGQGCFVTYSMYVNPGFPVPQWMVREGIKMELPHTLYGLRDRVDAIALGQLIPVNKSISAARDIKPRLSHEMADAKTTRLN